MNNITILMNIIALIIALFFLLSSAFCMYTKLLQNFVTHQESHDCFLNMQAVFSLVKYYRLRTFDYIVSDFFTTICRQAVHNDCFRSCRCQKFCVDLVRSEDFFASVVFLFLTHTCPSIGVKNVRTFNCFHSIFFNGDGATSMRSIFLSFS